MNLGVRHVVYLPAQALTHPSQVRTEHLGALRTKAEYKMVRMSFGYPHSVIIFLYLPSDVLDPVFTQLLKVPCLQAWDVLEGKRKARIKPLPEKLSFTQMFPLQTLCAGPRQVLGLQR